MRSSSLHFLSLSAIPVLQEMKVKIYSCVALTNNNHTETLTKSREYIKEIHLRIRRSCQQIYLLMKIAGGCT
jgi:hypothetical protein